MNRNAKRIDRLIFTIALASLGAAGVHATQVNTGAGDVSSVFLQLNPSVRASALGGDESASQGSVDDMFANPASLTALEIPELLMIHQQALVETRDDILAFGVPLKKQAFGFSARYLNKGTADRIGVDANGDPVTGLGTFRYYTLLTDVSWARELTDRFSFGAGLKGWSDHREADTTNSWAGDLGFQYRDILPGLDLGAAYRNVGKSVNGFSIPTDLGIGAAYHPSSPLFRATSLFYEDDVAIHGISSQRMGIEWSVSPVALRAGYQTDTSGLEEPLSHFSFGAGLQINHWRLDYAWLPRGILGSEQHFSVSLGLGKTAKERDNEARQLDDAVARRMTERSNRYYLDGKTAFGQGQWDRSIDQLQLALQWNPHDARAVDLLKAARDKKNFAEAADHAAKAAALYRDHQWLDAALQCEQALKLDPHNEEASRLLAQVQNKLAFRKTRAAPAGVNQDSLLKGIQLYMDGHYGEAETTWESLLREDPENATLREYVEKARSAQLEERVASLETQVKKKSSEVDRLSQQAYTLYSLGNTADAITLWQRILALDPMNQDAQVSLKDARAKEDLVKTQPTSHRKVEELDIAAIQAYSDGQLGQAATLWRQALSLDPRNRAIQKNLERAESEMGVNQDHP